MSNIDARCRNIIIAARKHLLAQKTEQAQAQQLAEKAKFDQVDDILIKLYDKLHTQVYQGCGFGTEIYVHIQNVNRYGNEILQIATKRSGLKLSVNECPEDWLRVELDGVPNRCLLRVINNNPRDEHVLDFAQIVAESNRRVKIWNKVIYDLAKLCIRKIIDCLESRPDNFYGIPQILVITKNGQNAFAGTFDFCGTQIEFSKLQPWQVEQLQASINEQISYGTITTERIISYDGSSVLWFKLNKDPQKAVDHAFYDYAEFYRQYDEVTPELKIVFQKIINNLQMLPEDDQFLALKTESKLVYAIEREEDWPQFLLAFGPKQGTHKHHLVAAIEKALPGIKIKAISFLEDTRNWSSGKGCAHGVYSENQRIQFECEAIAAGCEFVRRMLQTKQKILDLKTKHFDTLVDAMTEKMLYTSELIILNERDLSSALETETGFFFGARWDLTVLVEGHKIDPRMIADKELLSPLIEGVRQRTGGLIEVDLHISCLRFNIPSRK